MKLLSTHWNVFLERSFTSNGETLQRYVTFQMGGQGPECEVTESMWAREEIKSEEGGRLLE